MLRQRGKDGSDAFLDVISRVENIEGYAWQSALLQGAIIMGKMTMITAGYDSAQWNSVRTWNSHGKMEQKESSNCVEQIWQESRRMSVTISDDCDDFLLLFFTTMKVPNNFANGIFEGV